MEDRIQGGLKEGAGLEESRLNTEFIEFLRKWSTPLLVVIALVAASYVLYGRFQQSRDAAMAKAFAEYDAAAVSRNPGSLLRVAEEQSGRAAVSLLARLAAADLYLEASRTGIPPGITLDQNGALPEGTVLLTDTEKTEHLGKAAAEYENVYSASNRDEGKAIHTISSLFGLASVAESKGDLEKARERYTSLAELATKVGFKREAEIARKRIDSLPDLQAMPRIYAQSDLFIIKSAVNPIQVKTPDGSVVTVEGGDPAASPALTPPTVVGTPAPDATPFSSPAPQPPTEPAPEPPAAPK